MAIVLDGTTGILNLDGIAVDGTVTATTVGIGTSSPATKLHVYNSSGGNATDKATMLSEAVLKLQPHATNSTNLLVAQVNGGNGIGLQVTNLAATANWDLALSPFGGNVGIGATTNLTSKLTVNAPAASHTTGYQEDIAQFYTTQSPYTGRHYLNMFHDNNNRDGTGDSTVWGMGFGYDGNTRGGIQYDHKGQERLTLWSAYGDIHFKGNSAGATTKRADQADTDIMVLRGNGNVGIGTDAPVNVLQIGSSFPITMNGSYPDIHFNGYYSAPSYRTFTTGFGGKLTFNGSTGKLTISTGASSTTAGSDYSPVEIFGLDKSGNLAVDGGIKLGDDTRTAATSGAGALRWNSGKLQNSNGSDWKDVSYDPLGSSVLAPADSADAIVTAGDWNGDGFYWISTPNNGTMSTYCIKDTNGAYMVIGKFAANAKDTVQSTITTANVTVQDSSGTVFSSAFGDFTTNEIRFIGTDSIEGNWTSTRNVDFIHGQSNRAWKNCFYESSYTYVHHPGTPGSGSKPGYWCTYAKDGRGRWSNTDYRSHAMSDGFNQITQAAFTTPGSFYMEQNGDAKFTVMNTGEASGQDGIVSAGFGNDDDVEGFFDLYPSTTTNMGGGNTYSTAVYVLIR